MKTKTIEGYLILIATSPQSKDGHINEIRYKGYQRVPVIVTCKGSFEGKQPYIESNVEFAQNKGRDVFIQAMVLLIDEYPVHETPINATLREDCLFGCVCGDKPFSDDKYFKVKLLKEPSSDFSNYDVEFIHR